MDAKRVIIDFETEADADKFRDEVRSSFGLPIGWHHSDEVVRGRLVEQCEATSCLWPDDEAIDVRCSLLDGHDGPHIDESMAELSWEDD